jgi:prephenate dehydratase
MTVESLGWIRVGAVADEKLEAVASLGPAGTSSEQAANVLWSILSDASFEEARVSLHDTYELAADTVRSGRASHFVVANAYRNINEFYMDTRLVLSGVFVMDTPLYGLAKPAGVAELPRAPRIASHPSPVPLIVQLMPAGHTVGDVVVAPSTSAAARAVNAGHTDLALTTEPAARMHGLTFISRLRPIRMVWSVFTASPDATPLC